MKLRETINNNACTHIATVHEDAHRVIVLKSRSGVRFTGYGERPERIEFGSVAEYEAWKASQDWIRAVRPVSRWSAKMPRTSGN